MGHVAWRPLPGLLTQYHTLSCRHFLCSSFENWGTWCIWNLRVLYLQMCCGDYQDSGPGNGCRATCPINSKKSLSCKWRVIYTIDQLCMSGRVTLICVSKLTINGSDNGLSPGRRQAITDAGILLIGPLGTNFSEILVGILTFSFSKFTWNSRLCYSVHFVSASRS